LEQSHVCPNDPALMAIIGYGDIRGPGTEHIKVRSTRLLALEKVQCVHSRTGSWRWLKRRISCYWKYVVLGSGAWWQPRWIFDNIVETAGKMASRCFWGSPYIPKASGCSAWDRTLQLWSDGGRASLTRLTPSFSRVRQEATPESHKPERRSQSRQLLFLKVSLGIANNSRWLDKRSLTRQKLGEYRDGRLGARCRKSDESGEWRGGHRGVPRPPVKSDQMSFMAFRFNRCSLLHSR